MTEDRLGKLAERFRKSGFEELAQDAEALAKKAREVGMPDKLPPVGPPQREKTEVGTPVLTPELAGRVNEGFGAKAPDGLYLTDLANWGNSRRCEYPNEWNALMENLQIAERASISRLLRKVDRYVLKSQSAEEVFPALSITDDLLGHYYPDYPYQTVGAIREATVEQLKKVVGRGNSRRKAEFLKEAFKKQEA